MRPLRILTRFLAATFALFLSCHVQAGTIRFLTGEEEALQERLSLIANASQTIDIAYFQIRDDDSGGQVLAELVNAQRRGVQVRILVDAHGGSNSLPKHLMRYLIEQGISLRERPVDVRYKVELGRPRLHDKLFIVDNTVMIMGGRNLEQDFFGVGCRLYVDFDFLVTGHPVQCASAYYGQRWQECVSAQPRLSGEEAKKMLKKQVHKHWNSMPYEEAYCEIDCWLSQLSVSPLKANNLRCKDLLNLPDNEPCSMEFLHDCVGGSKQNSAGISQRILTALRQAKHSIQLSTPYSVISNQLQDILRDASHRGVRVTILTNSLESTDQVVAHAGYANQRRFLVRHGIHVLEYQGTRTLHAKMILIDGQTTILGSHNLDMLSEKRNSEVALLVRDAAFAVQANEVYRSFVRGSDRVERGELFRLEARESDASDEKRKEFQKLRLVAPFIKRYL